MMRKRRRYKGQVGVFRAPSSKTGWRRIDRRGNVVNVTLPSGVTEPDNVIKNPFRTGKWSWRQAIRKPRPVAPQPPTSGIGDTGFDPNLPAGFDPTGFLQAQQNAYQGPWVQGFDFNANQSWKPMVGGGYINVNTGQTWTDPSVAAAQVGEYEKALMESLKGLFGGQV